MSKKWKNRRLKLVSAILTLILLANIISVPITALDIPIAKSETQSNAVEKGGNDPPTSLDKIEIPSYSENPYTLNNNGEILPIYNTYVYNQGILTGRLFKSYGGYLNRTEERSQYYTGSILVFGNMTENTKESVTGSLPYNEERSLMLHPDITIAGSGNEIRGNLKVSDFENATPRGDSIWNYLDPDQVKIKFSGTLLSGNGELDVYYRTEDSANSQIYSDDFLYIMGDDGYYAGTKKLADGESYDFSVMIPLTQKSQSFLVNYTTWSNNGLLSDPHAVLIDDGAPYVQDVKFEMQKGLRDDEADLVMRLTFNEGIRYLSRYNLEEEFSKTYVTVYAWNATNGRTEEIKMYLESVDGGKEVVFRANIGKLHYCNLELQYISRGSGIKTSTFRPIDVGVIDLADGMVLGAGKVMRYGNGIHTLNSFTSSSTRDPVSIFADHAGNEVDLTSLWSTNIKEYKFYPDTFEAEKVEIYNDKTLGIELGNTDASEAKTNDSYVGPARDMTVYIWTDRYIEEAAWKQIYINFNILDADGNNLKAYVTSATKYRDDEVYADGTKEGMLLKFENIPITQNMSLDVEDGKDPIVKVTGMGTDYKREDTGYPTAYPYVKDPNNLMYADLTPPLVEIRKTVSSEDEIDDGKYYKVSAEITVSDGDSKNVSGLMESPMFISVGGGVESKTDIRYILSTSPNPPDSIDGYENKAILSENSMISIGGKKLINNTERFYVHIIAKSGGIYLKDLEFTVNVNDAAGNEARNDIQHKVDYIIDEISPTVKVDSKTATATDGNSSIKLTVSASASDHTRVDRILYFFGDSIPKNDSEWKVAEIEKFQSNVSVNIEKEYGNSNTDNPDENKIHEETLYIKAYDMYGNESETVKTEIRLSLEKPATVSKYIGDSNKINRGGELLISGADASVFDGADAYTRVTVSPMDDEYSYVTLVKTGEIDVDILSLVGLSWYRVRIEDGSYVDVTPAIALDESYSGDALDGLVNCYGEIKVSFENGYGNMTPRVGSVSSMANAGSYIADPDYYTIRYSSPISRLENIHTVDFGSIIDYAIPKGGNTVIDIYGNVVVEDADFGAAPYVFNQQYKGVNPMRNAQIHYSIGNIANSSFGLLDFNFESSYAELLKVGENGEADKVLIRQNGLWATDSQYFTVSSLTDSGEQFTTGAYYLKVTVVSYDGREKSFESSRIILDAQTADNAGLWKYEYESLSNITAVENANDYSSIVKIAEDKAFDSIGVSIVGGEGERTRNRLYATYSYGVKGLKITLSSPDTVKVIEGVEIGKVEGFKVWNLLSAPTESEIEAKRFEADGETLTRDVVVSTVYTSESIPKGILGMSKLFLHKGTNIICYQVKMANGYVSPIRQFTITVTDEVPTLSISIGGYQPSITPSQIGGVINADHVRYYIDTAYSVSGSGKVNVQLWSKYGMNLGLIDEDGNINDVFKTSDQGDLHIIHEGMKENEYADFTENSYTANFPYSSITRCTAVFAATDEYGGVTIVAPQLGDMERVNVNAGVVGNAHEIEIEYTGKYFDDPYDEDFYPYGWRILYNQASYFGAEILGFESYLAENIDGTDVKVKEIQSESPDLRYNLFNISTNDIYMSNGKSYDYGRYTRVDFDEYQNMDYILLSDATVTLFGAHIGENPVTVTFTDGDILSVDENGDMTVLKGKGNNVGYMYGYAGGNMEDVLRFYVANPRADAAHIAGSTVDITYVLNYSNQYGDKYEHTGTITLTYIDYYISNVKMTNSGAEIGFSFSAKDSYNSGINRTGKFSNGDFSINIPDYYGGNAEYAYSVDSQVDMNTDITYEKYKNTANPVTVTLLGDYNIYVDITDYAIMKVEGNGTPKVTVTVYENTEFSYRYIDSGGVERMYLIDVNNIYKLSPKTVWDFEADAYNTADDGTKYRYGSVTVYLTDENFSLIDRYTGEIPSFTFMPGADSSYTFKKEDIVARLGDEEIPLNTDITVLLPIVLYDVLEMEFSDDDDTESPNVQVKAYSKLGEAYFDTKIQLNLIGVRNSTVFSSYGYETYEYVGNRANMSEILTRMGWSASYRFKIDAVDTNKVKLFIKEGLYADAPDFNSGVSDVIEGVNLNSKLLTVTKNAKFTLFVVDGANNSSSVAFDVTNISDAPVPTVKKIPVSHGQVRLYLIAPDGVAEEDFQILSPECKIDTDTQSEYYLKKYIEISANDNYDIIYSIKYNGITVTDTVKDVSVTEISLDEIVMKGLEWSYNKASEATPNDVTAEIRFSHNISEIRALSAYDEGKVKFEVAGNILRVTYNDNHGAISISAIAENKTFVTVNLDSVTNIDRSAPKISIVSEELSSDGKSLTLTLSSNERASFKEGRGRVGEEVKDGLGNILYYYTVKITANGKYTFTFADMSGMLTAFEYTTSALVLDELEIKYNTSPSFDGAMNDPYSLTLKTDDKVYITPSRDVTADVTGMNAPVEMKRGEWFTLTIPDAAGGISPYIIYTDSFGNSLTHQFLSVEAPDNTPPEIIINKRTYPVKVGTSREEIKEKLLENMVAFDDKGGDISFSVEFTSDIDVIGLTDVKYVATDESGNVSTAYGKLKITSIYEPTVHIGNTAVLPDEGIYLASGKEVKLSIDTRGVSYKIVITNGIFTAAQMKGIESIDGYVNKSEYNLGILERGMYTVLIITEQREYFRIILSVEDV